MLAVVLAAVLLAIGMWACPRKHRRWVSKKHGNMSVVGYDYDLDKEAERAAFEALLARLKSKGAVYTVEEY
jgi:hypothetical protein